MAELDAVTDPQDAIRLVAGRLLDTRLDELVHQAVDRLRADEPEYATSEVSRADLVNMMRRTLALALTRAAGRPIPAAIADAAAEAGRVRARQRLPLPALLHAFRIDLRILWEAVIDEGRKVGLTANESFVESSVLLWEAVERNTAEMVDAYRGTEHDMALHLDELRHAAFERLIGSGEGDPAAAREAAKRLDLPLAEPTLVVVAEDVPHQHDAGRITATRLRSLGLAHYQAWRPDELYILAALGGRRIDEVLPAVGALDAWRCGAFVADGLAGVAQAVRLARAVIRAMPGPGLRLLNTSWLATLANVDSELGGVLARDVLGKVLALPEHERAAMLETLETYLDGDGSLPEVAAKLYRHRNTIRNRLQSLERITGLQLSRPRDLATVALAVAWLRGSAGRELTED
ncbi:PucR family transcriptional regulator [Amycolatopsis alkalitolerans]|nr:helix-turn-helix domain-containing protein [Amycolatopsis alkalitolerans]